MHSQNLLIISNVVLYIISQNFDTYFKESLHFSDAQNCLKESDAFIVVTQVLIPTVGKCK